MAGPVLTDADLDFVVGEAAPDASDRERLKGLVPRDANFRKAMLSDDRVFARLMDDEEAFLTVSPGLYFEVLLRRAVSDLAIPTAARGARHRRSMEDYEAEGRRFYALAGAHPAAGTMRLSEVFGLLQEHFAAARKPLTFISSRYLHARRRRLFGDAVEQGAVR